MRTATTIEVACGAERHRVTLRTDSIGRARWTLHDHDASTEDVLVALGGTPPPCAMVPRLSRRLAPVVPDVEERFRWIGMGARSAAAVRNWRQVGGIDDAAGWNALGVHSPDAALRFVTRRMSLPLARHWAAEGHPPSDDLLGWLDAGVGGPDEIAAWLAAGVKRGPDAASWAGAGATTPEEVARWRSAGVKDGRDLYEWSRLGVGDVESLRRWMEAGVGCGLEASRWMRAGVAEIHQLERWRALGITSGFLAANWAFPYPGFIRGFAELEAWFAAGVTNTCAAMSLDEDDQIPPAVLETRRRCERKRLAGIAGLDGRPQLIEAIPGYENRVRRVYFYCYGRRAAREDATHWVSLDVYNGIERRNRRREGALGDPERRPWSTLGPMYPFRG
ncbi:MAG: hypothetical protein M3P85_00365 [Actinomycetota bacterium]|nr:hypothetical protein [Actinomycetota bacterium]